MAHSTLQLSEAWMPCYANLSAHYLRLETLLDSALATLTLIRDTATLAAPPTLSFHMDRACLQPLKLCCQLRRRRKCLFAGLFALPQAPGSVIEGSCDELPIHLSEDEEGPFRSLFKYIYALPLATQADRISIADLQDILAVAHLAHKYEMMAWETWGFLVIGDLIRRHPSSLLSHDFVAIYNLCRRAFTQESEDLWAKTTVQWLERITDNDLPISDALNAAEASHDRHLLTSLYKIQLSRIPTTAASMFQPTKLSMDGISPVHVQRIWLLLTLLVMERISQQHLHTGDHVALD
ncbi:hypothetical protein B0H13DRAFT_2303360 [Mycena leptocephala]|nr:hypothetical protein B0H13DRAFT_2303360 [Mycena leptocephala]